MRIYNSTGIIIIFALMFSCLNSGTGPVYGSDEYPAIRGTTEKFVPVEFKEENIVLNLARKISETGSFGFRRGLWEPPAREPLISSAVSGTVDSKYTSVLLNCGDWLEIKFNVASEKLVYMGGTENLTTKAWQALDLTPVWLQDSLKDTFLRFSTTNQDRYADLIIGAPDPKYMDEIAFTIANLPINHTRLAAYPDALITENAEGIYAVDPDLDYVQIVEYGVPGVDPDYYTTVRYDVLKSGVPSTYELPRDMYYWLVAFPKLTDEWARYVDPATGLAASPPSGKFWRTYLYNDDPDASYVQHWVMKEPDIITETELQGWGSSTYGYFDPMTIAPLEIIRETVTGKPCMIEFTRDSGTVLATMMPVESGYEGGHSDLLINMLEYGNGDVVLPASAKTAIFKDRNPWGVATIETVLTAHSRSYDVFGSADMATVDLSTYKKVVIPSGQPYSFYSQLDAQKTVFEDFVKAGGVFEFHGATTSTDDWTGLTMPGGFSCVPQSANLSDTVTVYGHPLLKDVMQGTQYYWDEARADHPGDRFVEPDDVALDRVGNFVGKNMFDNVAEREANYGGAERSIYPVRIIYNHYGNCGELQDLLSSSCRTCLMPVWGVGTITDDHMWCEYFYEDEPYYYDVWWSNSLTRVGLDKAGGWRAGNSLIFAYRGEGMVYNAIDNYTYGDTATINFTIKDSYGLPVDAARIDLYSSAYTGYPGIMLWTDKQGKASAQVGNGFSYFVKVRSSLGTYPGTGIAKIVDAADCTPGSSFAWDYSYSAAINAPKATPKSYPGIPSDPAYRITADIYAPFMVTYGDGMGGSYHDLPQPGEIDIYIVDQDNYDKFKSNLDFNAAYVKENAYSDSIDFNVPFLTTDWILLVSNKDSLVSTQNIHVNEVLYRESPSAVPVLDPAAVVALLLLAGFALIVKGEKSHSEGIYRDFS